MKIESSMNTSYTLLKCNFPDSGGDAMRNSTKTVNDESLHGSPVITDRDLSEYVSISDAAKKHTGIDAFRIQEAGVGKFNLALDLTFKGEGYLLITARKTPRTWRNLHNLLDYIRSLDSPEAPISIVLLRESNEKPIVGAKGKKDGST